MDVQAIKKALASVAGIREHDAELYIVDDTRSDGHDLTLKGHQQISTLMGFTKMKAQLRLSMLQGVGFLSWQNTGSNMCVDDGVLEKISGVDCWLDAGPSSIESFDAGTESGIEWTIHTTDKGYMIGLSHKDTGVDYRTIEFAVRVSSSGNLMVFERGRYIVGIGPYQLGDRIRVGLEGGAVTYTRNDELLHTSTQVPNFPLLVDTSFKVPGAKATNVSMR
jgi:hypothetical protein